MNQIITGVTIIVISVVILSIIRLLVYSTLLIVAAVRDELLKRKIRGKPKRRK